MRQLAEGNLFTNFETIAAVFLFEKLQHMRLNIPKFESQEKKKLKKMIRQLKKVQSVPNLMETIKNSWVKPGLPKFDWGLLEEFLIRGSLL